MAYPTTGHERFTILQPSFYRDTPLHPHPQTQASEGQALVPCHPSLAASGIPKAFPVPPSSPEGVSMQVSIPLVVLKIKALMGLQLDRQACVGAHRTHTSSWWES